MQPEMASACRLRAECLGVIYFTMLLKLHHTFKVRWRHGRSVSCDRKNCLRECCMGAGTAASCATGECLQQQTAASLMGSRWMKPGMCTRALARV